MDLLSEYLLCFIVICLAMLPMSAYAGNIRIEQFSTPIKIGNKISQPINLSFSCIGNWKLLIQSIEPQIYNQNNPSYSIPISRLELAESSGLPVSNFEMGKILQLNSADKNGMNNMNLALNILTYDSDRAGNYTTEVKFTLIDENNEVSENVYNLRFTKEENSHLDFSRGMINLKVDKDKAFQKDFSQNLGSPLGIYVSSNKDWKLYLKKLSDSKNDGFSYFVKVLNADSTINANVTGEYLPLNNEVQILLASGKATTNTSMNCLDKKLINIDYMVKGPENKIVPAGSFSKQFEYRLETED